MWKKSEKIEKNYKKPIRIEHTRLQMQSNKTNQKDYTEHLVFGSRILKQKNRKKETK